ncbi:PAS domain S-box protein [Arthrospira platensis]|uniref:histidine kinase n=1 Tax=Limnospira platensis NIES-46 TaxID=1236695 RepID=A0A5M3T6K5_LIMPL|nr:PAS domain S-box protein [Arthrospira platensis]AMW31244.1 histidine kinase [Arthrospira platensis YZ]KDR54996.1 histidine kinase [Arthrospira platensis str. Paraca]MDF2208684.1 PAS domain S-box protein [Arthrospira platensis NCB002]MDT9181379.1 PAS domain S-box protein [Limnospira sp. PMC 289.06]MDT9293726.1 PAS domain S-box protein [Arthrospira platensis PCC 7345]MDT9309052.1 PAS domain S-box protein [Limnospira sp. Paracas R14]WAK74117.1 PAS domain S-box protein [Arthrospira sp. PCC 91
MTDANQAACELFGLERQDLMGSRISDFAEPGFNFEETWQDFLDQGEMGGSFRLIRPDGGVVMVEYVAIANFLPNCHLVTLRDVTEIKRLQEQVESLQSALAASVCTPEKLRQITEQMDAEYCLQQIGRHIPGVIYKFCQNLDGGFAFPYSSEGLREIYGIEPEAVRSDASALFNALHPDDIQLVEESILASAENLTPWLCEYRITHPDGRLLWLLGHATPQREQDGSTTWYGYVRDITEQKESEIALRRSESKFRNLTANLNDMVFIADVDGTFSYVSPNFEEITGYPIDELLGISFAEFVHSEYLPICVDAFHRALLGEKVRGAEYRVLHKNNHYYWHSTNVSAMRNDEGEVIGCLGIARYIHDSKQAEMAVRESHIRLEIALESADIGTWDWKMQTNELVLSEEHWRNFIGATEGVVNHNVNEWISRIHPEDMELVSENMNRHIRGEIDIYETEHRLRCEDGSYKWGLGIGQIVERNRLGEPLRFMGIYQDISQRKANELALQELTNQLQKAQKVAHLGNWSFETQTQKVTWSEEVFNLFGMSPEQGEPTFAEHLTIIHPDDRSLFQNRVAEANKGIPQNFDFRVVRAGDEVAYLNARIEIEQRDEQVVRMFGTVMDITERVKAQEQVYRSRELLQTILDALPQSVFWKDSHSVVLGCNQAFARAFGGENTSFFIGKTDYDYCVSRKEAEHYRACDRQVMNSDRPQIKLIENKSNADGSMNWVETTKIPLHDADGKVIGLVGIFEDITDRIQAERALKESEAQTRALLDAIPDMMFRYSSDYVFLDYKPSLQVEPLMQPSQFLGLNLHEVLPEFLAVPTSKAIADTLKTQHIQLFEYALEMPEGIRNYEARFAPCGNDVLSIVRDISEQQAALRERKKAEQKLQSLLSRTQTLNRISTEIRNSLHLDTILQNAVNAIFQEIKVYICAFVWYRSDTNPPCLENVKEQKNPGIPSWLGSYNIDNFPKLFYHLFHGKMYRLDVVKDSQDEALKEFCQQSGIESYLVLPVHTAGGTIGGFEIGRVQSDCTKGCECDRSWLDDEIELLQSLATQVAIAIYQAQLYQESKAKGKELQKAYRELQETQVQLIQAEKMSSLGQLLAGVAHEINNPVSFIYGNLTHTSTYTEYLLELIDTYQELYPDPPPEIRDLIEDIDLDFIRDDFPKIISSMTHGASRIRDIVKSLRTFSRLDEAKLKSVDIHENIDSTLVIVQNRVNGSNGSPVIQVIKDYGDLPSFQCYSSLLNQVFMNLVINAIQAIEEKRNRLNTAVNSDYIGCINIKTRLADKNQVLISITDNGIGINSEHKNQIFNPFFTTKAVGQGTGMGLPTSYQIITQNHHGELTFSSVPGVGTEFIIKLPLA